MASKLAGVLLNVGMRRGMVLAGCCYLLLMMLSPC
jgi:hypothetical protein